MAGLFLLVGLGMIAFAVWAGFWISRRHFERTNSAGVQEFKSFGSSVKANALEGLVKFAGVASGFVGILCVVGALFGMSK